jgi:hypothetical protein
MGRSIPDGEVDAYNELQFQLARDYVVHRPGQILRPASRLGALDPERQP